ncbi:MAG: patatin-like phospholipase family protein [Pirellulaceae bacterium]
MDRTFIFLKRHRFTNGLSDDEISSIAKEAETIEVPTGEYLHRAGDRVDSLFLIVQGRLSRSTTDHHGHEQFQGVIRRGSQFGGLAAAQPESIPVSVVALETSTALRLDYPKFLALAVTVPRLLINFIQMIGTEIKQAIRIDRLHQQPSVITIIHDTPASRPLTTRLINRLQELGETPSLMTDDPAWQARSDVPQLLMINEGRWMDRDEARSQIAQWAADERVFIEATANQDLDRLIEGIQVADYVLVCIRPDSWREVVGRLRTLLDREPRWKEKINLVWIMEGNQLHPPPAAELLALVNADFKVSFSDPPQNWSCTWQHGVERIVHELRGVRVGVALGGGAARGMAHLGVLKTLEENGIIIDAIAGTSAGAMTGTVFAAGMDMDYAVQSFCRDLKPSAFFRSLPGGSYWYLLYKYRRNQFDPMLRKYLSELALEQLPIPMNSITVDLVSGKPKVRDHGDAVQGIIESINLPGLAPPICRQGEALVDGGLVNNVPADVLVSKGCNYVIAVSVTAHLEQQFGKIRPDTPGPKYKVPSTVQTIMRGYMVQSVNMNSVGVQPADVIIEPDVTGFDISEFTRTDELAAVGAETTQATLEEIRKSLSQIDSQLFHAQ